MTHLRLGTLPSLWRDNAEGLACGALGNRNARFDIPVVEVVEIVKGVLGKRADELQAELSLFESEVRANVPTKIRNAIADHLGTEDKFITTTAGQNIDLDELANAIFQRCVGR